MNKILLLAVVALTVWFSLAMRTYTRAGSQTELEVLNEMEAEALAGEGRLQLENQSNLFVSTFRCSQRERVPSLPIHYIHFQLDSNFFTIK